jgi:ADP-ribosylglycohydrolase
MTMPGGGTWGSIGPGQATDDSELAMSLMHALIKSSQLSKPGFARLNTEWIGHYFKMWMNSPPFDIGNTTKSALGSLTMTETNYTQAAYGSAKDRNGSSISNGSMMRCTPMAVWASGIQDIEKFKEAVYSDVKFTHSNIIAQ